MVAATVLAGGKLGALGARLEDGRVAAVFTSAAAILVSGLDCNTGPKAATPAIGVASMGGTSAKPEFDRMAAASAKDAATLEVGFCASGAGVAADTATPGFGVAADTATPGFGGYAMETSEALGWDLEYYHGSKPDQAIPNIVRPRANV